MGQAQRIALARAILQNGRFWLLDEPTASLDARSEQYVMRGLTERIQQRTALFVTHQLQPLQSVERILVMEYGLLVQTRHFEDLSQQSGLFATMLAANQALQAANKGDRDA